MKLFYETYKDNSKMQPMVAEISWTKNVIIMEKCKEDKKKEFYMIMISKHGWTKNVLIHHLENRSYEKYLLNQTNFEETIPKNYGANAKFAVKDEYVFDFLELGEEHLEKDLEHELISKVRKLLSEMGDYFCFVASQYRIEIEDEEYFIDLLLYHRKLRCLVAVELKIGNFKPEYAGKMQFYLSVLDDRVKIKEENPSMGIIICKNKNRTVVEYALRDSSKPMGVATYTITRKLPTTLKNLLPSQEDLKTI